VGDVDPADDKRFDRSARDVLFVGALQTGYEGIVWRK
jgi:hypothetical protein